MDPLAWEYVPWEPTDLRDALVIVGVPSVGMVGPIAAGFLVDHLKMRVAGGFHSGVMPPLASVRGGIVTSPVQVWITELACGLDGRCDRLAVVRSDLPFPPETMLGLAEGIVGWARGSGARLVVGLEGHPTEDAGAAPHAAASRGGAPVVEKLGATPTPDAAIVGFNAALLLRANRDGLPAVGLFAPVGDARGEAQAAASLLELVDPLVPNIHLGHQELAKRAGAVEARMDTMRKRAAAAQRRMADQVDRSYA